MAFGILYCADFFSTSLASFYTQIKFCIKNTSINLKTNIMSLFSLCFFLCRGMWTHSLLHSRFQCRHATLLPTNGCWDSNHIPFPLCLWSNEQTSHVYGTWQYVSRRALGSGHASQFSTNESFAAEFGRALWLQATKRLICRKVCFKRLTKFQVKKRLLPGLVVVVVFFFERAYV